MATIRKRVLSRDAREVRWDAIWEVRGGKMRTRQIKTFLTQKEAKDHLVFVQGRKPQVSATFKALKEDFLAYCDREVEQGGLEKSTVDQLRQHLKLHIMPDIEFSN
jgi:hypothetical protein